MLDVYEFLENVASRDGNYLDDLVIDPEGGFAYITDAGVRPAGHSGGVVVKNIQ